MQINTRTGLIIILGFMTVVFIGSLLFSNAYDRSELQGVIISKQRKSFLQTLNNIFRGSGGGGSGTEGGDLCPDPTCKEGPAIGRGNGITMESAIAQAIRDCEKDAAWLFQKCLEDVAPEKCTEQSKPPEYWCRAGRDNVKSDGKACGYTGSCTDDRKKITCPVVDGKIDEKNCKQGYDGSIQQDWKYGNQHASCVVRGPTYSGKLPCQLLTLPPTLLPPP